MGLYMKKMQFVDTDTSNNVDVNELIRLRDERDKARLDYVNAIHRIDRMERSEQSAKTIEKVIFNPPATIVLWADGTKTVVKCQDDELFDPEKGLAMAFMKKMLGNKGNYYNTVDKWVHPYWQDIHDKLDAEFEKHWQTKLDEAAKALSAAVVDNKKGDEQP